MYRIKFVAVVLSLIVVSLGTGCTLMKGGGSSNAWNRGNMGGNGGGTMGGSGGAVAMTTPGGGEGMFGGGGNMEDRFREKLDRGEDPRALIEGLEGMAEDIEASARDFATDAKGIQAGAEAAAAELKSAAEALVSLMKAGKLTEAECETQLTTLIETSVAAQMEIAKAQFAKVFDDPAMRGLMEAAGGAMGSMEGMMAAAEAMNTEMIPITVDFYMGKMTEAEYLAKTQELTQQYMKMPGMGGR